MERRDEPAHARPHLRRSCADRAAVLPCRRPQHPDHAGAAPWRDRDDPFALHAGRDARRDRARPPDLDGAGARDHPGGDRASRLGHDRSVLAEGGFDRIDHRAAASDRSLRRARRAGAAGLWLDRNLSDRGLYPARRRSFARRLDRPSRPVLRGDHHRRRRQ